MFSSCLDKQQKIKELFSSCSDVEQKYKKIIELGRLLEPLEKEQRSEKNRVQGCQSLMYLQSIWDGEKIHFSAESDALISKGLAYLLVAVYSGETPETILKCPPTFLEDLGIASSLTPNRANGLYSLHLKMKQEALSIIVKKK